MTKVWRKILLGLAFLPFFAQAQTKINALPLNPGTILSTDLLIDDTGTTTYVTPFSHLLTFINANGTPNFNVVATGTNTNTLTLGSGGTLTYSGTGVVNANEVLGYVFPALVGSECLSANSGATALVFVACGSGSGITLQTNSANNLSQTALNLLSGSGIVVTNTSGASVQFAQTAPSRTVTASTSIAAGDMAGTVYMNVSGGGTLTIPAISSTVFPSGSTAQVTNYSASTTTVTATPTVNAGGGCVSGTGIPAGDTWQIQSNGTTLDCVQTAPASANTTFTVAGTGCTPSAHVGGAFAGKVTLTAGPCTALVITLNGATGYTVTNGTHCTVGDDTTQAAGTFIPEWNQSAYTTGANATVTLPIPGAAGLTDTVSFVCTPY